MTGMSDTTQVLADLRWLLLSPPLWSDAVLSTFAGDDPALSIQRFEQPQLLAIETWLDELAEASEAADAIAALNSLVKQNRLGRYAEQLLWFYLAYGPVHRLLAHNLVIKNPPARAGGTAQTVRGEVDFLLTDAAADYWHWELAVKYFLCEAPTLEAQVDDFVGPEGVETMRLKLEKLFGRQLRQPIPPPWDQHHWQRGAFARGRIFYPLGQAPATCASLATDHCRGWWLPQNEIDLLADDVFMTLPRLRWLAPVVCRDDATLLKGRRAVTDALLSTDAPRDPACPPTPVLLARLRWHDEDGQDGQWQTGHWRELDRGFIVS